MPSPISIGGILAATFVPQLSQSAIVQFSRPSREFDHSRCEHGKGFSSPPHVDVKYVDSNTGYFQSQPMQVGNESITLEYLDTPSEDTNPSVLLSNSERVTFINSDAMVHQGFIQFQSPSQTDTIHVELAPQYRKNPGHLKFKKGVQISPKTLVVFATLSSQPKEAKTSPNAAVIGIDVNDHSITWSELRPDDDVLDMVSMDDGKVAIIGHSPRQELSWMSIINECGTPHCSTQLRIKPFSLASTSYSIPSDDLPYSSNHTYLTFLGRQGVDAETVEPALIDSVDEYCHHLGMASAFRPTFFQNNAKDRLEMRKIFSGSESGQPYAWVTGQTTRTTTLFSRTTSIFGVWFQPGENLEKISPALFVDVELPNPTNAIPSPLKNVFTFHHGEQLNTLAEKVRTSAEKARMSKQTHGMTSRNKPPYLSHRAPLSLDDLEKIMAGGPNPQRTYLFAGISLVFCLLFEVMSYRLCRVGIFSRIIQHTLNKINAQREQFILQNKAKNIPQYNAFTDWLSQQSIPDNLQCCQSAELVLFPVKFREQDPEWMCQRFAEVFVDKQVSAADYDPHGHGPPIKNLTHSLAASSIHTFRFVTEGNQDLRSQVVQWIANNYTPTKIEASPTSSTNGSSIALHYGPHAYSNRAMLALLDKFSKLMDDVAAVNQKPTSSRKYFWFF